MTEIASKSRWIELSEMERMARQIEGDSDNPLRIAAANEWWGKAAKLRRELTTPVQTSSTRIKS